MSLLIALAFLLFSFDFAYGAIAVVQSASAQGDNVSSVTTGNITSTGGNLFICDVAAYSYEGHNGLSDSKGNTYNDVFGGFLVYAFDSTGLGNQFYASGATTGGASHNFTSSWTGASDLALACKEVSGATSSPLDQMASKTDNNGSTTSFTSDATSTTAQNDELITGAGTLGAAGAGNTNFTATGGFTANVNLAHSQGGPQGIISASKVVSTTGAQTFTFTVDQGSGGIAWVVTYKATVAAATAARRRIIRSE